MEPPARTRAGLEWQSVPLHVEGHTDPDFNGPGCPCSWDDITFDPVLVPAGARLDAQGGYRFPGQ